MFENTPGVHLTVYRGGASLESLNMLGMRSGFHLFDYICTLVNVKAPVVATTNWWWLISALVVA